MENDYLVPLRKLRCIRVFYETGLLPFGDDEEKNKAVEELVLYRSSVYRGCNKKKYFKLGDLQTVQNRPFQKYYEDVYQEEERRRQTPFCELDSTSPSNNLQISEGIDKISSIFRTRTDQFLIRRPTIFLVNPLARDDVLFRRFAERLEMKPKLFRTTMEQYVFYTKNFPLLLDSKKEEDKAAVPRKRAPTPEKSVSAELKREIQLKTRLRLSDRAVDKLEEETDDIDFKTELRSIEFDPTKWEWNKKNPPFPIEKRKKKRRRFTTSPSFSPLGFNSK